MLGAGARTVDDETLVDHLLDDHAQCGGVRDEVDRDDDVGGDAHRGLRSVRTWSPGV